MKPVTECRLSSIMAMKCKVHVTDKGNCAKHETLYTSRILFSLTQIPLCIGLWVLITQASIKFQVTSAINCRKPLH